MQRRRSKAKNSEQGTGMQRMGHLIEIRLPHDRVILQLMHCKILMQCNFRLGLGKRHGARSLTFSRLASLKSCTRCNFLAHLFRFSQAGKGLV